MKKATSRGSLFTWNLIDSWDGNDSRFFHRDGGERYQDNYWIDRFDTTAPAEPICGIGLRDDLFTLSEGAYKVIWDCSVIFRQPACDYPRPSSPVLQLLVWRMTGEGNPLLISHTLDQVNVCANRDELVYDLGIESQFRCRNTESSLDFKLHAYDRAYGDSPKSTNIKEVIVRTMEIYKK